MNKVLTFKAPTDINGHVEQLVVDTETKAYKRGYYLFVAGGVRVQSKKDLTELEYELKQYGFKKVEE